MSENTPYFQNITANRSIEQYTADPDGSQEGTQLISIETQNPADEGLLVYINENFDAFLRHLRHLSRKDQELLLAYYGLGKTQESLAPIFKTTQTMASFGLRMASKAMTALLLWGGNPPTVTDMEPILKAAGFDRAPAEDGTVSLAEIVEDYHRTRSFTVTAKKFNMWRPDVRRTLSRVSEALRDETRPPEQQALGYWIARLIEKAHPTKRGITDKERGKMGDVYATLPDIVGQDVVHTRDTYIETLFVSRYNP